MRSDLMKNCYKASDKILTILEELGYVSQRKPSYENELRDIMTIEIKKCVEKIVIGFYNDAGPAKINVEEFYPEEKPYQNKVGDIIPQKINDFDIECEAPKKVDGTDLPWTNVKEPDSLWEVDEYQNRKE